MWRGRRVGCARRTDFGPLGGKPGGEAKERYLVCRRQRGGVQHGSRGQAPSRGDRGLRGGRGAGAQRLRHSRTRARWQAQPRPRHPRASRVVGLVRAGPGCVVRPHTAACGVRCGVKPAPRRRGRRCGVSAACREVGQGQRAATSKWRNRRRARQRDMGMRGGRSAGGRAGRARRATGLAPVLHTRRFDRQCPRGRRLCEQQRGARSAWGPGGAWCAGRVAEGKAALTRGGTMLGLRGWSYSGAARPALPAGLGACSAGRWPEKRGMNRKQGGEEGTEGSTKRSAEGGRAQRVAFGAKTRRAAAPYRHHPQ